MGGRGGVVVSTVAPTDDRHAAVILAALRDHPCSTSELAGLIASKRGRIVFDNQDWDMTLDRLNQIRYAFAFCCGQTCQWLIE